MGGCVSVATPEERDAQRQSSAIDRQLRNDAKDFENTIKILLLGKCDHSVSVLFSTIFSW